MRVPRSLSALLAATFCASVLGAQDPERAQKLFVTNCASCHGETGDGKGTTELDRPARSFQDGGFSFGNTPEALFKTISTGIPGSPMAGFDGSLSEEERRLLADYVVTLGPPIEEVKEEDMILTVKDRPLVVRGLLPSLGEGLEQTPRGLLIGDPSGITFEYRVDDVRLLALRQGGFVKRSDWTGRGGTPLEPLGKVVQLLDGGKPEATFGLNGGRLPLEARLSGTSVKDGALLSYHLLLAGREVAHVEERPSIWKEAMGTGFSRSFELTCGARPCHLALKDPTQAPAAELAADSSRFQGESFVATEQRSDGTTSWHSLQFRAQRWSRKDGVLIVDLQPGEQVQVLLVTIPSVVEVQ